MPSNWKPSEVKTPVPIILATITAVAVLGRKDALIIGFVRADLPESKEEQAYPQTILANQGNNSYQLDNRTK